MRLSPVQVKTFMSHVDKRGCWIWTGLKTEKGYGRYGYGGRRAHRVAYEHFIGPIPSGLWVLHKCDNPSCVNPRHLFLGTAQDNQIDMKIKGRGRNAGLRGEDHPMYGRRHSEVTRAKLRQAWERRREARA